MVHGLRERIGLVVFIVLLNPQRTYEGILRHFPSYYLVFRWRLRKERKTSCHGTLHHTDEGIYKKSPPFLRGSFLLLKI